MGSCESYEIPLQMTLLQAYKSIHSAWDSQESSSDIYHMILEWIQVYRPEEVYPEITEEVQDWMRRALNDASTNDLVEDFIYGAACKTIRATMDSQAITS